MFVKSILSEDKSNDRRLHYKVIISVKIFHAFLVLRHFDLHFLPLIFLTFVNQDAEVGDGYDYEGDDEYWWRGGFGMWVTRGRRILVMR